MSNIDPRTVASFGDELSRFDQLGMPDYEARKVFGEHFSVIPWKSSTMEAEGFDMGCGSGRWVCWVAPRVGWLHCIEPLDAIEVARRNLTDIVNIMYHRAGLDDQCLPTARQDFDY